MTETHLEKRLIGYARVSTVGQTLDSQLEQLRTAGCSSRNIYREKVTGARADTHRRRKEPRRGPRKAYGAALFPHTGTDERGHPAARAGRDVAGIGRQLRPEHFDHAPRHPRRVIYCRHEPSLRSTLLGDLATLTRNVVRLGHDRLTAILATPTRIQHRALDLLGVVPTA